MSYQFTVSAEETFTNISDNFIKYHMNHTNGEFVKVYLYLAHIAKSHHTVSVEMIAEKLLATEKDVCRALKYWSDKKLITIHQTKDGRVSSISCLPVPALEKEYTDDVMDLLLGQHNTQEPEKPAKKTVEKTKQTDPVKPVKTPEPKQKTQKERDEDFSTIVFQVETYLNKELTRKDYDILNFIYDTLGFSADLMEYLIETCVEAGTQENPVTCRTFELRAIDWNKAGVKTIEDAKKRKESYNAVYMSVMKAFGLHRKPTETERNWIDTWRKTFSQPLIIKACTHAIEVNPTAGLSYIDTVLEDWRKHGVSTVEEAEHYITEFREKQNEKMAKPNNQSQNQFNRYTQSTTNDEIDDWEKLFLKETNQ